MEVHMPPSILAGRSCRMTCQVRLAFKHSVSIPARRSLTSFVITDVWNTVPFDTDILVTHTPPYGIQDITRRGQNVGCEHLLKKIKEIKPKVCIFGHIHEAYGVHEEDGTVYINACTSNSRYKATQLPVVLDLPKFRD